MDIYQLIAAAAQQGGVSGTPSGPDSYYSYDTGTENDDWEAGINIGASINFNESDMFITVYAPDPGNTNEGALVTADAIDLTGYSTITINTSTGYYGFGSAYLIASSTQNGSYTTYDARVECNTYGAGASNFNLDVSGLDDSYYIRVNAYSDSKYGGITCTVYSIYLST